MVVGVVKVTFHIPASRSLKAKRQVLRRLLQRVSARFKNVSVSEVGDQDLWQKAVVGLVTVGSDGRVVNRVLDQVLDFVEEFEELEVVQAELELISM